MPDPDRRPAPAEETEGSTLLGALREPARERASLVIHHRDGAAVVPLERDVPIVIGRASPSDVVLPEPRLSRRHARFTWRTDGVWVEDLESRNGTELHGRAVDRALLQDGDEVDIGRVRVLLHALSPRDDRLHRIEGHDRFLSRVDEEIVRCRTFGRSVALLLIVSSDGTHTGRWLPALRGALRPVDGVGAYGPASVLVSLPEMDGDSATAVAKAVLKAVPTLVCGISDLPARSGSLDELVGSARDAFRRASASDPIRCAPLLQGATATDPLPEVVVASPAMQRVFETVDRLARAVIPVLVVGETGSGKEVVARALHARGPRRAGPMRAVNCGALAPTLVESLLFGHEKGAFTGADRATKGLFEQADGGTLFLDEIGELSPQAQVLLLRVLETKRVSRIGASGEVAVDVRIVAATHRQLEDLVKAGRFREDLLYRLNAFTLVVPPLRERRPDVRPLAERFLVEAVRAGGGGPAVLSPDALALLESYAWPGNVRELRNVVERAVVLAQGDAVEPADLPDRVRAGAGAAPPGDPERSGAAEPPGDLKEQLRRYEADLILRALADSGGRQVDAARRLGMPLRTLVHKIRTLGLKKKFEQAK